MSGSLIPLPSTRLIFYQSHATHHVLAIYGLGASSEIIEEAYSRHDFLKSAFDSPEPVTDKNFARHLGDDR